MLGLWACDMSRFERKFSRTNPWPQQPGEPNQGYLPAGSYRWDPWAPLGSLQVPDLCREDKGEQGAQGAQEDGRGLHGDLGVQLRGCVRGSLLPLLLLSVQLGGRNSLQTAPALETASIPVLASEDSYLLPAGAIWT